MNDHCPGSVVLCMTCIIVNLWYAYVCKCVSVCHGEG